MSDSSQWWTKDFQINEPTQTFPGAQRPAQEELFQQQQIQETDVNTLKRFIGNIRTSIQNVKYSEGSRGIAERGGIFKRRITYTIMILLLSAVVNACFKGTQWEGGGILLLACAAVMTGVAAVGTIAFPDRRKDVTTKFSEMFWGWCIWPAVGVALFDKILRSFLSDPTHQSQFGNIFSYSLPYVFAITLLLPPALFIKSISLIRSENRDNRDIEESMRLWQRQDGDQR